MKSLLIILLFVISVNAKSQSSSGSASIPLPVYDTLSIEIESTNSFYFGKKLYSIPRQCEDTIQTNCCSYNAQITKWSAHHVSAQISCYDGTSLRWTVFDTEQKGKDYYESYQNQIRKQMKSFNHSDVRLQVHNKDVTAKRLNYTTYDGHPVYDLIFYGTINGDVLVGHVIFLNNVMSSKELTAFFQQLIQF